MKEFGRGPSPWCPPPPFDLPLGIVPNSVTSDFSINSFKLVIYEEILTKLETFFLKDNDKNSFWIKSEVSALSAKCQIYTVF